MSKQKYERMTMLKPILNSLRSGPCPHELYDMTEPVLNKTGSCFMDST